VKLRLALAGRIARAWWSIVNFNTNVRLVFGPDPHQQIVDVFTWLCQCAERVTAMTAFAQYLGLPYVEVANVKVPLLGLH
jgi:hypothetical protein